jgi:hypothetical protein
VNRCLEQKVNSESFDPATDCVEVFPLIANDIAFQQFINAGGLLEFTLHQIHWGILRPRFGCYIGICIIQKLHKSLAVVAPGKMPHRYRGSSSCPGRANESNEVEILPPPPLGPGFNTGYTNMQNLETPSSCKACPENCALYATEAARLFNPNWLHGT